MPTHEYGSLPVERLAAFADGMKGGNPAGVVILDAPLNAAVMAAIAAAIGYSETAFATPEGRAWRVRYFAPAVEVDFCGHATIALGAALARRLGSGTFPLRLNQADILVEGRADGAAMHAALVSPPTWSRAASVDLIAAALALFALSPNDLDLRIPPTVAHAGANHLILALRDRGRLAAMQYDLERGRDLAQTKGIVTFSLIHAEAPQLFHARNPFPIGGVWEDPATGAAAAALGGTLRDLGWPHDGCIEVIQGEDMGMRSRLWTEIGPVMGEGVRVSGSVRALPEPDVAPVD